MAWENFDTLFSLPCIFSSFLPLYCNDTIDRTYQILVIEDNLADTRLIKEAFRQSGCVCDVKFAQSDAAEEFLNSERFDLVLLDFEMLAEQAVELVDFVRARVPYTPMVVLSGYPDPLPAYRAGVNAFIHKDLSIDEFFVKIKGLMNFWANVAELPFNGSYAVASAAEPA